MNTTYQERILIVDTNPLFLERLAQELRARNFDVVATESGAQAFHVLRDWTHPVDWLFSRATMPGLIDGWILADEYRDSHPTRAAVIATPHAKASAQGHVVLEDPSPAVVLDTLRGITAKHLVSETPSQTKPDEIPLVA
ncbi:response regulator [Microvirga lotononidis]|uniref:response regulator n=1 Tax=Microvirga lotononidis TaxID=864069 RepID=UPI0002FF2E49|nr:response regulator [Microvirga lotononidis]WQO31184.1 response regulator [Microvirga lotononidis]